MTELHMKFLSSSGEILSNYCPVCGKDLDFPSWNDGSPSDDICPSCGIQFGYHDVIRFKGSEEQIVKRYEELRGKWIMEGMKWHFPDHVERPPKNWDPKKQLLNIGIEI